MKKLTLVLRSLFFWTLSVLHFFPVCTFLVLLGVFVDPRKNDRAQRVFFRNILRVAGVEFEVRRAPGFDPARPSIFISNHVNIFDAFVIYSAIPQFVRGWELESHFKIPAYGWMMGRFGNIPIPAAATLSEFKKIIERTQGALDGGISVIVFPEGSRTRTGGVGEFQKGIFSVIERLGCPVVPMSIVGSFEFHRTGDWKLYPGKIVVHLHDTIETRGMSKEEIAGLGERVRRIVSAPVEEARGAGPAG